MEAVIAISIVGVVGVLASTLLSRAFRGSNKTELLGNIRQNGQTALSIIDGTIRNSLGVVCTLNQSSASIIAVRTTAEGKYVRFIIKPEQNLTANGYIIQQQFSDLTDAGGTYNDPELLCDTSSTKYPETGFNRSILTDQNINTGVSIKSGNFSENSAPGYKDVVTVIFDLGPAVKNYGGFENLLGGSTGSVRFQTSIQLKK